MIITAAALRKKTVVFFLMAVLAVLLLLLRPALAEELVPGPEGESFADDAPEENPEALISETEMGESVPAESAGKDGEDSAATLTEAMPIDFPDGVNSKPFIPESLEVVRFDDGFPDETSFAVIGSDDRTTIKDLSKYPYCAIAYLEVTASCGETWTGTGFMIGDRWLMTAGHCLYCTDHGAWAQKIIFYFGYRNRNSYYFRYNGGWKPWISTAVYNARHGDNSTYSDYDYGYVRLEKNIVNKTGCFGFIPGETDSKLSSTTYYCAGYADGKLKVDRDRVQPISENRISHTIDTVPGNSGAPIYTSDYYAVAINTAHALDHSKNFGVRITRTIYDYLRQAGYPN